MKIFMQAAICSSLILMSFCNRANENEILKSDFKLIKGDSCTEKEKINNLFKEIINIPLLQQYLNIQKEPWVNQKNLVIMKFESFTDDLVLEKFNHKVLIMSKSELEKNGVKAFLKIDSLGFLENNLIQIKFGYPIQGIEVKAVFEESSLCSWKLKDFELWEK